MSNLERFARFARFVIPAVLLVAGSGAFAQTRTHGIDVSSNQGTMNWNTAYNQNVRFAFVRATRGPSSGPQSLNDSQFSTNVTNLRNLAVSQNKVIYNGFYHYGRPDVIAINDGNNGIDDAGFNATNSQPTLSAITTSAQDEADHFWSVVGSHYSIGGVDVSRRLPPVLDVEERGGDSGQDPDADALTPANLTLWVDTFINRFVELSGGVRPILYMNTNYATNFVTSSLADETLWVANWSMPTQSQTGNPGDGVFPTWAFWQYDSPNGLGTAYGAQAPPLASPDMDLDVANGDINFVRSFLVPEPGSMTLAMAAIALFATSRPRRRAASST